MKERFRSYVWFCPECLEWYDQKPKADRGRKCKCHRHAMKSVTPTLTATFRANFLPEPFLEYRFHPQRKWEFDWAFVLFEDRGLGRVSYRKQIAVEVEGGVFARGRHVRGKGFLEDCEKYNEAAILGWRVLRFTPEQITSGAFLDVLKRAWEAA